MLITGIGNFLWNWQNNFIIIIVFHFFPYNNKVPIIKLSSEFNIIKGTIYYIYKQNRVCIYIYGYILLLLILLIFLFILYDTKYAINVNSRESNSTRMSNIFTRTKPNESNQMSDLQPNHS